MNFQKKILIVGLNTIDIQFFINTYPISNTKSKAQSYAVNPGGPATNAAVVCSALGSRVDLISPVGEHEFTPLIKNDLHNYRVNLIDPLKNEKSEPIFASIATTRNGERTIISYFPNRQVNSMSIVDSIRWQDYSCVLFDGFYPELSLNIAKKASEESIVTLLDGGSWKANLEELAQYIDIAICSNDFKTPLSESKDDTIRYLSTKGVRQVVFTRGEKSILIYDGDKKRKSEVHPPKVKVIDSLGAGDFFHGAFCHYYSKGNAFELAIEQAAHVASTSCTTKGTRTWLSK